MAYRWTTPRRQDCRGPESWTGPVWGVDRWTQVSGSGLSQGTHSCWGSYPWTSRPTSETYSTHVRTFVASTFTSRYEDNKLQPSKEFFSWNEVEGILFFKTHNRWYLKNENYRLGNIKLPVNQWTGCSKSHYLLCR